MASLTTPVEARVRQETQGRIRDLTVREDHGRILIRGRTTTDKRFTSQRNNRGLLRSN
jgi:hypothetical protein